MSRYYDVSFKAVIEADNYEHACKRAQQVAQRAAQLNKEIGSWFCGMDWAGDADDADPGVPETHEVHPGLGMASGYALRDFRRDFSDDDAYVRCLDPGILYPTLKEHWQDEGSC
jgi:hypothetical protein